MYRRVTLLKFRRNGPVVPPILSPYNIGFYLTIVPPYLQPIPPVWVPSCRDNLHNNTFVYHMTSGMLPGHQCTNWKVPGNCFSPALQQPNISANTSCSLRKSCAVIFLKHPNTPSLRHTGCVHQSPAQFVGLVLRSHLCASKWAASQRTLHVSSAWDSNWRV